MAGPQKALTLKSKVQILGYS